MKVEAVIPALDEEGSIEAVVRSIPRSLVEAVWVVDNGSRDRTAERAAAAGARVVHEPRRGYGAACLAGIAQVAADAEAVLFLDADGSDDPACIQALLEPISRGEADLVVGSRTAGLAEPGALTPAQRLGNAVAAGWLRARYGLRATDLGPFRAIRASSLRALGMSDAGFGWTVEMQIKAARQRLRYLEVLVPGRARRAGKSKISGTLRGTVGAGVKILLTLARHDLIWLELLRRGRRHR